MTGFPSRNLPPYASTWRREVGSIQAIEFVIQSALAEPELRAVRRYFA